MLNIAEYKEYSGENKIALMDNSALAFMHELSHKGYPVDGILDVYDLILIPKWVMEEIQDSTYRSSYVEQLQAQGYPVYWIDETKYGTFVGDEDVNLYYIVEAAVLVLQKYAGALGMHIELQICDGVEDQIDEK